MTRSKLLNWTTVSVLLSLQAITPTKATPEIGLPFDQQLPDIPRVGESYSFAINSQTFESTLTNSGSGITYQAFNLPSWLSFDDESLTFTGTPSESDATDDLEFILMGTDSEGSLNQTCTLIVSSDSGPILSTNSSDSVDAQLQSFGETDGDSGLILEPNEAFSLQFSADTFQMSSGSSNQIVNYYGRFTNRTSLPNWISFDSDSLTFSGTAPTVNSQVAPSMEFGFMLIATDYSGYTAAYATFNILVGANTLTTNSTSVIVITSKPNDSFSKEIPLEDIFLNSVEIESSEIQTVSISDSPSWVSIQDNSVITGTVPADQVSNEALNVTITDIHGNSVFLNFEVEILDQIFTVDSLPTINATRNTFFQYTLNPDDFTDLNNTDINAKFDNSSWLTYYYTNYTFTGNVPNDFTSLDIELEATMGSLEDTLEFEIQGVGKMITSSSAMSSSFHHSSTRASSRVSHSATSTASHSATATATASASATPISTPSHKDNSDTKKKLAIGLGVGIPVFLILLAALLLFCCCFRRRKDNKDGDDEDDKEKNFSPPISNPVFMHPDGSNSTLNNYSHSNGFNDDNDDLLSAKRMSALNVLKLNDKENSLNNIDDDNISDETNVGSNSNSLYGDAINHQSTDMLISHAPMAKVSNSWRQSSTDRFRNRDSLNSLATIATNDLLTVRVADDPNIQRRSQMDFFNLGGTNNNSGTRPNSSSLLNSDSVESSLSNYQIYDNDGKVKTRSTELHTLQEEEDSHFAPPTLAARQQAKSNLSQSSSITSDMNEYSNDTFHSALSSAQQQQQQTPPRDNATKIPNSNSTQLMDFQNKLPVGDYDTSDVVSGKGVIEDNSDSSIL